MRTNKRRKKRKGGFLMTTGLLLIAAALLLTLRNTREQQRADEAAAAALGQMMTVMPQEENETQTLALADADGNLLDWPLDRQGEPMPWPVEDGAPVPAVVDGEGRTVYWTQLRGNERPAQTAGEEMEASVPALEAYPDADTPENSQAAAASTGQPDAAQDGGMTELFAPVTIVSPMTGAAPAQSEAFVWKSPVQLDAEPDDGTTEPFAPGTTMSPVTHAASEEGEVFFWKAPAQTDAAQDALSGWTVDAQGALLPWVRDAAGRLSPWPKDGAGQAVSFAQLRQKWQELRDTLSPLLAMASSQPPFVQYPEMEMPTKEIDGQTYIGMVEVPSLELSLPVISEWTYPRLKKAPCRYVGSVYSKDMVICGHNYDRHFGRLKDLAVGDEVRFTDMDGNVFFYSVCGTEQLGKYAVEDMLAGEWDLTLFTCTKGGRMRVTVRCKLERYVVGEGQEQAQTGQ